jgi:hypothetical protein
MRSQNKTDASSVADFDSTTPRKNFLAGAALGAFVSIFLMSLSMSFGHVALADIGFVRPAIVLAIALTFGLLTLRFNGSFFNSMMNALSNLGT